MQVRISGTINPASRSFLKQFAEDSNISQSQALEKAIQLLKKQCLFLQMKDGYLEDQEEAVAFAESSILLSNFADEV